MAQVIPKSSNVGAAKIALDCLRSACGTDSGDGLRQAPARFPGEVAGSAPAKTWRPIEQATMSYGHGMSVNLLQLARAYTVLAATAN